MRIVFMGTPGYAVPTLRALVEAGHDIAAVYTRADAASGRGSELRPSEVKAAALELDLPVLTPPTLRDAAAQEQLRALQPQAIVVAAYGMLLPQEVLDIPPLGTFNAHASLLPRWRGAACKKMSEVYPEAENKKLYLSKRFASQTTAQKSERGVSHERNYPCRRRRNKTLSADEGYQQAAPARV